MDYSWDYFYYLTVICFLPSALGLHFDEEGDEYEDSTELSASMS